MTAVWALAALWLALALVATLLSLWLRIATALSEIVVGAVAQLVVGAVLGGAALGANQSWITFLAGTGAIVLTFLAGAKLDPSVLRTSWRATAIIGLSAFFAPFLGSAAAAYLLLHWSALASWLAGVALSTTSVAVVYAVMLELGLNTTEYGKAVLAACFVNDLGTVAALGLIFSPFTVRSLIFVLVRRLRTLTSGLLTPSYFIRAGSFVSLPALVAAPGVFVVLFAAKMVSKAIGVHPATAVFRYPKLERMYTTLLMSTGLTFGSISALFGLTQGIITRDQYSFLVAAVIGSAVIPTLVANAFYLPHHLLPRGSSRAPQVAGQAAELSADAIVIGHRGHSLSFIERWLVGSVAKRVLAYAHCTVIVVR